MEDILYKELILDLNRHPLNKKELKDFDIEKTGLNPTCGDKIAVQMRFDGDMLADIGWTGTGCAISQAAMSLITDEVKGATKSDIQQITKDDMINMLGIPISHTRLKCALLGWQTIQEIIIEHKSNELKE